MVLFFNFVISNFGKIFQKLIKFTLETKTFLIFFQFFYQCVNHNGHLEKGFNFIFLKDQTKKIKLNEKVII
jgi:hypothetical protein